MPIFSLFLVVFFTLLSSFFSLSQIVFFSLPTTLIHHYKKSSNSKKRTVSFLLSHPQNLLITILFCDIGANILVQNSFAILFKKSNWLFKVGTPLLITLIIGEILPKAIAFSYNKKFVCHLAPIIDFIRKLFHPILNWLIVCINRTINLFFPSLKQNFSDIPKEELEYISKNCESHGIINKDESHLICGYLELIDCIVKERMQPRNDILSYDITTSMDNLITLFSKKNCSRVPVYKENIENLLGICYANDFFLHFPLVSNKDLIPLLKKPFYIPETISAKTALCNLVSNEKSIGIVIDEYGSITGLITLEDLFEIVVGNIVDKRDETSLYTRMDKYSFITKGKLELVELEQLLNYKFSDSNDISTIGGWLIKQLGKIPQTGDKFIHEHLVFQVLNSAPNKIKSLYIRKLHD